MKRLRRASSAAACSTSSSTSSSSSATRRIPNEIHIPLDGLEIGDSIHISAGQAARRRHPGEQDEDFTVATIVAPSAMKAEEEEAAAAGEVPTVEGEEAEGEGGEAPKAAKSGE